MWNKSCIVLLACLFASPTLAQVTPVIFEREDIHIDAPAPKPAAKDQPTPQRSHASLAFNIEVRPEDALRLEYIHTLNALEPNSGVMIAFTAPSIVALPALKVPTPIDALFVNQNGTISEILPNVVLADLAQDITAHSPVKAFLFLKAGTVKAQNIQPQDVISAKQFTPAPPVMQ